MYKLIGSSWRWELPLCNWLVQLTAGCLVQAAEKLAPEVYKAEQQVLWEPQIHYFYVQLPNYCMSAVCQKEWYNRGLWIWNSLWLMGLEGLTNEEILEVADTQRVGKK